LLKIYLNLKEVNRRYKMNRTLTSLEVMKALGRYLIDEGEAKEGDILTDLEAESIRGGEDFVVTVTIKPS
jgi:hypothetical protein